MLARKIPEHVITQANELLTRLTQSEPETDLSLLKKIQSGETLAPDDWALVQETFDKSHPLVAFFRKYRNELSRQRAVNGRKCTAVAMITFTYRNEQYVLLMENIGLAFSEKENEVQWTAHGTRVDELERQLTGSDSLWRLFTRISGGDDAVTYFIAAAVRRIKSMGIALSEEDIAKIHLIDRAGAGFPEEDKDYRTEYINIELGERDPVELMQACGALTSTRFGRWTRCFKLSDLNASIKAIAADKSAKHERLYEFTYNGITHAVRATTWSFLKALQLVRQFELQPEGLTRDPWTLRNIGSYERALQWVRNKMDEKVQITIFSEKISRFSSAQTHAYAAKAKLDPENVAYTFLLPERLVLHSVIAHLTALVIIRDSSDLEAKADRLYKQFFQEYPHVKAEWERIYEEMKGKLDILNEPRFRELLNTIQSTRLDERHDTIYHLHESDLEIAKIIYLHEQYQAFVLPRINEVVRKLALAMDVEYLERYPLNSRQCFGVTGPVASGKSVSENLARSLLRGKNAAFISSDEWNRILSACLDLDNSGYSMQRGKLTLAEAWFIKVITWNLIKEMEKTGHAPNWIQEACDPASLESPLAGSMHIFINTANAKAAAARVKDRGDRTGRYISASAATGSYRWPWLNFLSTIEKIRDRENTKVQIMDTDVMYGSVHLSADQRLAQTNIAEYQRGTLEIHNLQRFIYFIARSYNVNPSPRNPAEVLTGNHYEADVKLKNELRKLFQPKLGMTVRYKGENLTEEKLMHFADRWSVLDAGINAYASRARFGLLFAQAPNKHRTNQLALVPRASL